MFKKKVNQRVMCTDQKEVIVGGLDIKRVLAGRLLPATVAGVGGAPPAVVVEDRGVVVHVGLLTYKHIRSPC